MNYYLEITLLPNPDINLFTLWSKVFQQLHLGLVEMQDAQKRVPIGVSFPEYVVGEKYSLLGGKCRLFAQDEATLAQFDVAKWLVRLSDYVHYTSIRPVPEKPTGYAVYQRYQPKIGIERLARRYAKRHNLDYETALNRPVEMSAKSKEEGACIKVSLSYKDMPHKTIGTPFIRLKSLSSDNTFCLWIKKTTVLEPTRGAYSSYGLSAKTTVPEF